MSVLEYQLPIQLTPQKDGGFVATCSEWSDCYAQGETVDEAILEITAVAQSLIELYREEGLTIPLRSPRQTRAITSLTIPIIVRHETSQISGND